MKTPHGDLDRWPDPASSKARRSVFAQDLVVEGDATSSGPIEVQGKVVGSLRAPEITVADSGRVEGSVARDYGCGVRSTRGSATVGRDVGPDCVDRSDHRAGDGAGGCCHACGSGRGTGYGAAGLHVIFPSNRVRVMVATKPIDFRKGHDSLAAMVKNELRKDPFTGTVFVFRARKADRLKLLYWDGTGLVMAYKRLEEHSFTWPAVKDGLMLMNHAQFEALFAGLDWRRVRAIEAKAPEAVE